MIKKELLAWTVSKVLYKFIELFEVFWVMFGLHFRYLEKLGFFFFWVDALFHGEMALVLG
jgi:hypothetical protein